MKLQHSATVLGALFTLAGTSSADVILVDAAGGGSFTQIQAAVDAAVDGDTLLVKPGSYLGFSIAGKALNIIGDVGTRPTVTKLVTVSGLAAGQTVTLARLSVAVGPGTSGTALRVENCVGAVRCVESDLSGRDATASLGAGNGVELSNAPDVAFGGCTITGGHGRSSYTCVFDVVGGGGSGIYLLNGATAVYDCTVGGGHGGNGGDRTGPGGSGMMSFASGSASQTAFAFASRSNIHGGAGGNTDCPLYGCPNDGGAGYYMTPLFPATTANGWILDSMVVGGPAGVVLNDPGGSNQCPADPGEQYYGPLPFVLPASSLGFAIPSIARAGEFLTVTFTGTPGSRVYLNDDLTTTFEAVPSWRGVLLAPFPRSTAAPVRAIKWGVIPASGVLTRTYNAPQLPLGVQAQTRFLQAYRIGANGITLGSFRTLTVLDSAF
jgi:hypothetical protein